MSYGPPDDMIGGRIGMDLRAHSRRFALVAGRHRGRRRERNRHRREQSGTQRHGPDLAQRHESETLRGSDFVLTGWSTNEGTSDLFALTWRADGLLASGWLYGGVGAEQGLSVAPASGGWALRVDQNLHIDLDVGSVAPYEPTLRDQVTDNVQVACADTSMYTLITPLIHDLNVNRAATSVGGAYQAGP